MTLLLKQGSPDWGFNKRERMASVTEKSFLVLFGRKEKDRQILNSYLPQPYSIKLCVLNTHHINHIS